MSKLTLTYDEFVKITQDRLPGSSSFKYGPPQLIVIDHNGPRTITEQPTHVEFDIISEDENT